MKRNLAVFDAMGVLYRHGNVVRGVLIPYLQEHGCTRGEEEIRAVYRRCTLGEISTGDVWSALGVAATASDADYCSRHELTTEAPRVLRELHDAGITPLVLTNDAAPWSELLRDRFELTAHIEAWFVSSELGARKPDPAAYRALLAHPALDPTHTPFIDDRPTNLRAAQTAGFQPILIPSEDTNANLEPGFQPDTVHTMPALYTHLIDNVRRNRRPGLRFVGR